MADLATYAYASARPDGGAAILDAWALVPYDLTHGVVLPSPAPPRAATLVSAQFLHGSPAHVVANVVVLLLAGPAIERAFGTPRFAAFYLACGIAGWAAQIAADPGSHVPVVGASGAIAGVLGAYAVRFPLHEIATLPAAFAIGLWALVQAASAFGPDATAGIAYFAHLGGFVAGVLLAAPSSRSARA